MKRWIAGIGCAVESAILVALFWKYWEAGRQLRLSSGSWALLVACVAYGLGVLHQGMIFRDKRGTLFSDRRFERNVWMRLSFLTGPCAVMSVFLIVMLTFYLERGYSKGIVAAANLRGVPRDFVDQWCRDHLDRIRSERLTWVLLAASTCLLYVNRYLAAKRDQSLS